MIAEILTIGDELCRGEIVDTNSAFLAAECWEREITVAWKTSCRDDEVDMREAFTRASTRADVILCSGGLGPTIDDRTVDVLCSLLGVQPTTDEAARERMLARYKAANYAWNENALRQVRVPQGATCFPNSAGAAPGFVVTLGKSAVVCMPGVPREMKALWHEHLAAVVSALRTHVAPTFLARRVLRVFGRGESQIATVVEPLVANNTAVSLHFQVKFPETLVKLVARADSRGVADQALADIEPKVREALGPYCYGSDDTSLAQAVGDALRKRGATLAVAESCTAGLLGATLTEVPGASAYFWGGVLSYANAVKRDHLGVSEEILGSVGAVSEECVRAMAEGCRNNLRTDYALAITGIAGPDGGTPDKPVGTVWLACAGPQQTKVRQLSWPGARDQIRVMAVYSAMSLLLRELQ